MSTVIFVLAFIKKFGVLFFVTLFQSAYYITYLSFNMYPSEIAIMLSSVLLPLAIAIWVLRDAAINRRTPCFDFGLFAYAFMPFVIPGYLFQHYRWKGLLISIMFFVLWLAPSFVYGLFYMWRFQ